MQVGPMENVGIIDVARWWFHHYPSDVFTGGEVAKIRRQFACIMIRRHKIRMRNLSQDAKNQQG